MLHSPLAARLEMSPAGDKSTPGASFGGGTCDLAGWACKQTLHGRRSGRTGRCCWVYAGGAGVFLTPTSPHNQKAKLHTVK